MEKLFEDLFVEENKRVPLAAHCLEGPAHIWWKGERLDRLLNDPFISWAEFKEKLFDVYFSNSIKEKLKNDLKNLRQGSRTVMEYEQEFSRLVNYIPSVIWNDRHKCWIFVDDLRLNIYQLVQQADLKIFWENVDRATLMEHKTVVMCAKRERMDKGRDKK